FSRVPSLPGTPTTSNLVSATVLILPPKSWASMSHGISRRPFCFSFKIRKRANASVRALPTRSLYSLLSVLSWPGKSRESTASHEARPTAPKAANIITNTSTFPKSVVMVRNPLYLLSGFEPVDFCGHFLVLFGQTFELVLHVIQLLSQ